MSGIVLEPVTSQESIEANFQTIAEFIVALQGGSIALSQITGYEDLVTQTNMTEEVTKLQEKVEKLKIPVGGRYYSSVETNPADFFGYGTWELIGAGRVEIGVGTETDSRGEERTLEAGATGGEFQHKLTEEEMPEHDHYLGTSGVHRADGGGDTGLFAIYDREYSGDRKVKKAGGGNPHNNMQPYEVIYKWERTA